MTQRGHSSGGFLARLKKLPSRRAIGLSPQGWKASWSLSSVTMCACLRTGTLRISQMQCVSLQVFSGPSGKGNVCLKPCGWPQQRWKNSSRFSPSSPSSPSSPEQVAFLSVPGVRTAPGRTHLSTGTENKSLVNDACEETDQKSINQAAPCPLPERPPGQQIRNTCPYTSTQTCSLCHPLLCTKMLPQETAKLMVGIT